MKSSPKIKAFQPLINMENGTDFVRIYKDIGTSKENPKKTDFYKETSFSEVALSTVNYSFFSNTLALVMMKSSCFLFCENDPKSRMVMNPNDQFKLMDF
jgi:hypothetical protein